MTFKNIQDKVMDRLNLTTDEARNRIKGFINERVRATQTSCHLGIVRRGSLTLDTVADQPTLVLTGVALPGTLSIPAENRILTGATVDQLRSLSPSGTWRGVPSQFAIASRSATEPTVEFGPVPDDVYTVKIDGILAGVDLVADDDVPVFPEDFHDTFVYGACADEQGHFDREDRAEYFEKKFEKRKSEARLFIARQIYLHRIQNGMSFDFSSNSWWWLYGAPTINP